jgi:hypothetical protein
MGSCYSYTEE